MALYNIYNQVTGTYVTNGSTKQPIIVELNVDKTNIRNTFQDERDLIISLHTGEEIIIHQFFDDAGINKLVVKENDGNYSEIIPSSLNQQGLFEVVDYMPIENFAEYLYQASVATSGMDWVDAAVAVGAAGITAGIFYENEKGSTKTNDLNNQNSQEPLNLDAIPFVEDELENDEILNVLNHLELENSNAVETWDNFQVGTDSADIIDVSQLLSDDATVGNIQDYLQVDYDAENQTAVIWIDRDGASASQYVMTEYLKLTNLENALSLEELLQNKQIIF